MSGGEKHMIIERAQTSTPPLGRLALERALERDTRGMTKHNHAGRGADARGRLE